MTHFIQVYHSLYVLISFVGLCVYAVVVQSLSHVRLFCDPMDYSTAGFPVHHQLPEPTQTHVNCFGDVIQQSQPLLSISLLPSIFPSIRVISNELILHVRWPKY